MKTEKAFCEIMDNVIHQGDRSMIYRSWSGVLRQVVTMVFLAGAVASAQAAKGQTGNPDYTNGHKLEGKNNYWNLGSIGVIGNIWGNRSAGTGEQTRDTRMIQIKSVIEGSPADGVLKEGDVILGLGKERFTTDARKTLSAAITKAEKRENGGELMLNVWRAGETRVVTITLPVLGSFSDAPTGQCRKTEAIIEAACKNILDRGLYVERRGNRSIKGGIPTRLEVLGLLATGEEKYLPVIKDYVRKLADSLKEGDGGFHSWNISYETLLLTEYYLATRDGHVLPAINKVAVRIALGASDVGTFSHGSAYHFMAHGKKWKYPSAYGAMNQCSITCAMALVLARKCGVENDEVNRVIERAAYFYRWYVDKGTIPYGDHMPSPRYDNNGGNSQCAVLFDLLGEKDAAEYFTRMTLSSYRLREAGHTGHFFSYQWGALGAGRGGNIAAHSFVRNTRWFTELERRADGSSVYQFQLGNMDHGKYRDWSSTGSRLLQHCLPRKKLYITGKGGSSFPAMTVDEVNDSVVAAVFDPTGLTIKELLSKLGSWCPVVRRKAAEELGEREDNVVGEMIAMLDSPNRYARYGAAEGLSYAGRGSEPAIDALVKKVKEDSDLTMRYYAACAFRRKRTWQGPPIRRWKTYDNLLAKEGGAIGKAIPALLNLAATFEPEKDPLRKLHNVIAATLFSGGGTANFTGILPGGKGIEKLDRELFIPAIKSLLINPNGGGRSIASAVFSHLTTEDLEQLWGDIYYATKYQAPSGSMFAGGVRGNGLSLMVNKGIEEGIPVGIDWALRQEGWGNGNRKKGGIPSLLKYGKSLEGFTEEIDEVLARWTKANGSKNNQEHAKDFRKRMAEAVKKPGPELKSIKPYIENTPDPLAGSVKK